MMSVAFLSGTVLLAVAFVLFTMALGGIMYQHIVELPLWETAAQPPIFGKFFKLLMPTSFFGILLAILTLWTKAGSAKLWLIAAMLGIISTTVFTNKYFVPLHEQLFHKPVSASERKKLLKSWRNGNLYRMVLMLLTAVCLIIAYSLLLINQY